MAGKPAKPNTFAVVLKRLREQRGLSERALSLAAGLAKAYVTQVENGDRGARPGRDTVLRLAQALRATTEETAELLASAGHATEGVLTSPASFEQFIAGDALLRSDQKQAMIATYRSFTRGATP